MANRKCLELDPYFGMCAKLTLKTLVRRYYMRRETRKNRINNRQLAKLIRNYSCLEPKSNRDESLATCAIYRACPKLFYLMEGHLAMEAMEARSSGWVWSAQRGEVTRKGGKFRMRVRIL